MRYGLISGTADIRPKRLQLLEKLSFVHDRGADMFHESGGDVVVN